MTPKDYSKDKEFIHTQIDISYKRLDDILHAEILRFCEIIRGENCMIDGDTLEEFLSTILGNLVSATGCSLRKSREHKDSDVSHFIKECIKCIVFSSQKNGILSPTFFEPSSPLDKPVVH